ncbi:MAG: DUF2505 family protein [Actinomycetaceae bacterium]|nr:DUF2505 family protein [Actinomycetaceae bacterium]MDY6083629.1 DUF2505 family protein [Actinomycetaceae bacterium]
MHITEDATFSGSRLKVARALLSRELSDARADLAGLTDVVYRDDPHSSSMTALIDMARIPHLPAAAAKALPKFVKFTATFSVASHTEQLTEINMRVNVPGIPVQFFGRAELTDEDTIAQGTAVDHGASLVTIDEGNNTKGAGIGTTNSRTHVAVELELKVKIPFIGSSVEKKAAAAAPSLFRRDRALVEAILAR